jgi:RNA 2',3'-cyclic 3'-phosphodiesterase
MVFEHPRVFLALWPDAPARAALAALPLPAGAVPVHPHDLHLTLAFLGPLSCADPRDWLAQRLPTPAPPVRVQLDAVEIWEGPRVVCATGDCPAVAALVDRLRPGLLQAGKAPEPRPFRAHVTLARKLPRSTGPGPSARQPIGAHPLSWVSDRLSLVASQPAGGRRYHEVAQLRFG